MILNKKCVNKTFVFLSLVASLSFSAFVYGDDEIAKSKLQEAERYYFNRSAVDEKPISLAIGALEAAEKEASEGDLKYKILILASRAYYWKGVHTHQNSEKLELHSNGMKKAEGAIAINKEYADGYYYAGINLARWGEAKNILEALFRVKDLKNFMAQTMDPDRVTLSGDPGETIDGYGPDRVLGRLYFKLPTAFGGDREKSLKHLENAFNNAKETAANVLFYAEALSTGSSDEKELAKQYLKELLGQDPTTYNPDRIPETIDEFELAHKLRSQI